MKDGALGGDACLLLLTIGMALLLPRIGTIGGDSCLLLLAIGITEGDAWLLLLLLLLGFCGMSGGIGGDACLLLFMMGGLGVGAFMILMISSALKMAGLCSQGVLTFIEDAESSGWSSCSMSQSFTGVI
jgi:hypothetical protein